MRRNLDIEADLVLSSRAGEVRLRGSGRRLTGKLQGLANPWRTIGTDLPRESRRRMLRRTHQLLTLADVELDLTWKSRTVARLGPGSRPGLLSRILGATPLEVRPLAWIRSLLDSVFGRS